MAEAGRKAKRILIGIVGGLVVIIGIIMIPYPGPGWVVVFAGLAILATEFPWAQRVLDYGKGKYDAWDAWLNNQNEWIRLFFIALTTTIVIGTVWLINGYGIINSFLGLHWDWMQSPIPFFR